MRRTRSRMPSFSPNLFPLTGTASHHDPYVSAPVHVYTSTPGHQPLT